MLKIWSKQLLMIKPDPTPYLMASSSTRLLAAVGTPLLYTDSSVKVLVSDTLSNTTIGTGAFDISFTFKPNKSAGYRALFQVPGLVKFAYNWTAGYGLIFDFEGTETKAVSTTYIPQNEVVVRLYKADPDADIVLLVDTLKFTLVTSGADEHSAPEFTTGQLVMYDKSSFNNLILQ